MIPTDNKTIVLAYHEAFYNNDRETVRKLLADKGLFQGPLNSFTDADTFLDNAAIFMRLSRKNEIKKVFVDGEDACIIYDSAYIVPTIPTFSVASWFKVENGKIKFFHVHFDPNSFVKAKENGDIAKSLEALSK